MLAIINFYRIDLDCFSGGAKNSGHNRRRNIFKIDKYFLSNQHSIEQADNFSAMGILKLLAQDNSLGSDERISLV
jgi:hypothetical protein